jgi:outer membrane lipopolysaccharide assembly protein LptE/RlpB
VRLSGLPRWAGYGLLATLLLLTTSCGYHTSGHAVLLPADLHTIYVPGILNASQTYHIGQTFSEAVVRELRSRTNYRIVTQNDGTADATLSGTITSVYIAPLTYDSVTGRISTSLVVVTLNASLTGRDGKVLWSNPSFLYREQYQESRDAASFFEEEEPAVQRIATSFAKTLVSNILEAF